MKYSWIGFFLTAFVLKAAAQGVPLTPTHTEYLTIKPARTVSFTTDEGSYMNIDLSPDGKTLLFDLLGDIYTVPATGGEATQLTRGIALNLRPVWSPNGDHIACISDTSGAMHLTVRDAKGRFMYTIGREEEPVEQDREFAWLPDGHYIAMGQRVYGIAGGKLTTMAETGVTVRFSVDGRYRYYLDSGKLIKYDYQNGVATTLIALPFEGLNGVLAPDESTWVYIHAVPRGRYQLRALDLASGQTKILLASLFINERYPAATGRAHFSFTADSKEVYIGCRGKIHRINVKTAADEVIPFSAKVNADLGPLNYHTYPVSHDSFTVRYIRDVRATPDGKRLFFAALGKVYTMASRGAKPVLIAEQDAGQFQPVCSPDGQWVAYVTWNDAAGGHLWKVPAAGGAPVKLTSVAGQYQHPAWSPDSKQIAVVKGELTLGKRVELNLGTLELVASDGTGMRTIRDSLMLWNQLGFLQNGTRIVYSNREGNLTTCDVNGGNQQIVAREILHVNLQRHQPVISPDGKYLVYAENEDLYLLPLNSKENAQLVYGPLLPTGAVKFAAGMDPYWEKNGEVIGWTWNRRFYKATLSSILANAAAIARSRQFAGKPEENYITAAVKPFDSVALSLKAPSFFGKGTLALKNARLITMKGDQVIERGTVIIKNGRIRQIGEAVNVVIPTGAAVYDMAGFTIMPGMVDVHLHMGTPKALYPQQSWMFLVNFAFGVTTARDPYLNYDSYGYSELLQSGKMRGPRLFSVGRPAVSSIGLTRLDSEEEARSFVQKRLALGSVFIKQYYLPTRMQRQWLLKASREAGLNVTNEGGMEPMIQLAMMKDGCSGIEHSACWGDVYKDVVKVAVGSGTFFTPTLQAVYSGNGRQQDGRGYFNYLYWQKADTSQKLQRFLGDALERLKVPAGDTVDPTFRYAAMVNAGIIQAGGKVALGSHGNNQGVGPHNELWALQMGGLTNLEALRVATLNGAEALGMQKDLGSLEPGKIADLLVLARNPLEDIHNSGTIQYVIKDGVLYNADTLEEIWPIRTKCPEWKIKDSNVPTR